MRALFFLPFVFTLGAAAQANESQLRINQIQVIGTHNSYHAGLAPSEGKVLESRNPRAFHSLEYKHQPLAAQLDAGIRQVEIDVFADPDGGRFAHPANLAMVKAAGLPADPPYDPDQLMVKPGFKVMHVQGLDQRSTCPLFTMCLQQIRDWSKAHPSHLPIFILVETKQGKVQNMPQSVEALDFTKPVFDALDAEMLSVFHRDETVLPDDVRGSFTTLPEAISHGGWPTLQSARGKVVFLLDQRSAEPIYTEGHLALRGRVAFTNATPGQPDAAFTEENNGSVEEINKLVKNGYLVRTRTDEPTEQARTNDTKRRDIALTSGAQMLSTDYPLSEPSPWSSYSVSFPGQAMARCNPLNAPKDCQLAKP